MKFVRNVWPEREKYLGIQKARTQALRNKLLGISSSSSGTAKVVEANANDNANALNEAIDHALDKETE